MVTKCLYGHKADDVLEQTQSLIFCYCLDMKFYGALNKHPGFQ